jgi:site-specific DNA-methyltransferase (cytosine-N4-specific)
MSMATVGQALNGRRGRCGRPIPWENELSGFAWTELRWDSRYEVSCHSGGVKVLDTDTQEFLDVYQLRAVRQRMEWQQQDLKRERRRSSGRNSNNCHIQLPLNLKTNPATKRRGQTVELYLGNCLEVLKSMPDKCIDCVITSPPYWGSIKDYGGGTWQGGRKGCDHQPHGKKLSAYGARCERCGAERLTYPLGMEPTVEEYIENLCAIFDEIHRVLKDTGSIWVNLGDAYASRSKAVAGTRNLANGCLWNVPARFAIAMTDKHGWVQRNNLIWQKPNSWDPNRRSRFQVDYENFYFFTKKPTGYYFDRAEEPGRTTPWRAMRSVIAVASGMNLCGHDSAFPEGLLIPLVLSSCPPAGVVLDPFMGSGTTAVVAAHFGRNVIGTELNPDFWSDAAQRCGRSTGTQVNLIPFAVHQGTKKTTPAKAAALPKPKKVQTAVEPEELPAAALVLPSGEPARSGMEPHDERNTADPEKHGRLGAHPGRIGVPRRPDLAAGSGMVRGGLGRVDGTPRRTLRGPRETLEGGLEPGEGLQRPAGHRLRRTGCRTAAADRPMAGRASYPRRVRSRGDRASQGEVRRHIAPARLRPPRRDSGDG